MTHTATATPYSDLLDEVRRAFRPGRRDGGSLSFGLEAEFIPVFAADGRRVPLRAGCGGPSPTRGSVDAVTLIRTAAGGGPWAEEAAPYGTPRFRVPGVGVVSFEPGGQVELSTDPFPSVGLLWAAAEPVLRALYQAADRLGIQLVARGMDPENCADDVPLFVAAARYRRQAAHYARVGPWGRRMMLNSAAVHLNLDLGGRPVRRWWAANALAPYLVALFANSSRCEGATSDFRSFRAEQWRHLDPGRTGVFAPDEDPAHQYTRFALEAPAFLLEEAAGTAGAPFRSHWEAGADREAWRDHLTTLFPEVRPRGYLELRSVDALPPCWLRVPLVVAGGLLYAPEALEAVLESLPAADGATLLRAGRLGMRDPAIAAGAARLFDLALEGAASLGEEVVDGASLELAREFRSRFVAAGLDPGCEDERSDPFTP